MTLRFRPEVAADLRAARSWYDARRVGLGDEFMVAVDRLLARIDARPDEFPRVKADTRRALLRRFPYAIFFTVEKKDRVVLAVLHQAASPKRWPQR
jgi:plasmid stabilization system protein ParE